MPSNLLSHLTTNSVAHRRVSTGRKDHFHAIYALAISPSGKFIASGGSDGTRLWDLTKYTAVDVPTTYGQRGQVSSMRWLRREVGETLCYGTGLGYLACWRQNSSKFKELCCRRLGKGQEITTIATDEATTRLAIGTRDGIIQVWTLDSNENLVSIFSIVLETSVPTGVAFAENSSKDIYVFGLYDGTRHTLRGVDGKIMSEASTDMVMGRVAVSNKRKQFVIDNGIDGFDIHDLDDNAHIIKLMTGRATTHVPKQVEFADNERLVVGGSDHGIVYVFDRRSGEVLERLSHSKGLVQTIATHDSPGQTTIACASSNFSANTSMSIWIYPTAKPKGHTRTEEPARTMTATLVKLVESLFHLIVMVATIIFLWQNLQANNMLPRWRQENNIGHILRKWNINSVGGRNRWSDEWRQRTLLMGALREDEENGE